MEYLIVIAVAVAIAVFDDRVRGKKKMPPPTVPQDIPRPKKRTAQNATFEIPPMRGIPSDVQVTVDAEVLREQELRSKWEEARKEAQRAKRARERDERAARLAAEEVQTVPALLPHAARMPSVADTEYDEAGDCTRRDPWEAARAAQISEEIRTPRDSLPAAMNPGIFHAIMEVLFYLVQQADNLGGGGIVARTADDGLCAEHDSLSVCIRRRSGVAVLVGCRKVAHDKVGAFGRAHAAGCCGG